MNHDPGPTDLIEISGFAVTKDPVGSPIAVLSCETGRALTLSLTEQESQMLTGGRSEPSRPWTSEVITWALGIFGSKAEMVVITKKVPGGSIAEIHVTAGEESRVLPCSGADALAVAKATKCTVFAPKSLIEGEQSSFLWDPVGLGRARDTTESRAWLEIKQAAEEPPIIRVANTIFREALAKGASEFSVEPNKAGIVVKYLVDGKWEEAMELPKYIQAPITARLKMMADLSPEIKAERQLGHISIRHDGRDFFVSLQTEPGPSGESFHMRVERA